MPNKKRRKSNVQGIVTALLSTILLIYIGFQAYRSVFDQIDTELAVQHSVFETIESQGLIFRSETVIRDADKGYPYYEVENGTRVAKNSAIASVYPDKNSGHINQQIQEIDAQIAAFQSIQADVSSERLTLDNVNEQTKAAIYQLIRDTSTGHLDTVDSAQFTLLSLLSKRQLITGKSVDFANKIEKLKKERANLKDQYHAPSSVIKASVAGYFVNKTDGYETKLKVDQLSELTVKKLESYLKYQPKENAEACGKIVSGYEWYMACILPDTYYNALGVGKPLSLRMSFVMDEAVPATVYACHKDNRGNMAIVFRCDYMSAELSGIRNEAVQIQLVEHTGLKVPKKAIVIKDQQAGVYVRSGNVVAFRKIRQIFSEPADYVICELSDEDGYLRMYDDIIVGGKNLYDGKIIR